MCLCIYCVEHHFRLLKVNWTINDESNQAGNIENHYTLGRWIKSLHPWQMDKNHYTLVRWIKSLYPWQMDTIITPLADG